MRTALWVIARLVRAMGIGTLAGLGAGFLVGGVGSRLAMKVVALTAGPSAQGMITENGNQIGVFTTDTVFLLFLGAFLGVFGGLLYVAMRPWLPRSDGRRGLAFGALLLATCGTLIIDGRNLDFHSFGIAVLNVGLFGALFVVFGLVLAPLADYADRSFPTIPPPSALHLGPLGAFALLAGSGLLGLIAVGVVVGVGVLGSGEASADIRAALVLFLALLAVSFLARALSARTGQHESARRGPGRWGSAAIRGVLAVPVLIGLIRTVNAFGAILTA